MQLTRSDLAGFPEESVKYVLNLQREKGWRATLSNRGHVAMLSPDGVHRFGLSSNSSGLNYLKRDVDRYYASKGGEEEPVVKEKKTEKFPCPRPDCYKFFNSLENLDTHIGVDHEGRVKCPDCSETFAKPHVMGIHRAKFHGYVSPTKARRLELKALRETKKLAEEGTRVHEEIEAAIQDGFPIHGMGIQEMLDKGLIVENPDDVDIANNITATSVSTGVVNGAPDIFEPDAVWKDIGFLDSPEVSELQDIDDPEAREKRAKEIVEEWAAKEILEIENHTSVKDLDFIDERDSWTLDLRDIGEFSVDTVIKNMVAAGLNMEIRVWKQN